MSETLQLKPELRTRIRVMKCADYVVSLMYYHLPRLYTAAWPNVVPPRRALVADGTKTRTAEEEGEASSNGSFTKQINHSCAECRRSCAECRRRRLGNFILAGNPRSRQKARLGRTAILPAGRARFQ